MINNNIIVRISDFYCNFICKYCDDFENSSYFTLPLSVQIGPDTNSIKYFDEKYCNYFVYDKDNFKRFSNFIDTSYEDLYCSIILEAFERCFNKYSRYVKLCSHMLTIDLIYDDVVLETYGKNLYEKALNNVKVYFKETSNYNIKFIPIHAKNAFCGEIISDELSLEKFRYSLHLMDPNIVCHKEIRYNTGLIDSTDSTKKCYLLHNTEVKYGKKVIKYLIIADLHAHATNYYTYVVRGEDIMLYDCSRVNYGFMDLYYWINSKIYEENEIPFDHSQLKEFYRFDEKFKKITILSSHNAKGLKYEFYNKNGDSVVLDFVKFNSESPVKYIIDEVIKIKFEILNKHRLDDEIIIEYNVENYCGIDLHHIENKRISFNGGYSQLLKCLHFVKDLENDNLCYSIHLLRNTTLVYEKTGIKPEHVNIPFKNVGYNYNFDFKEEEELNVNQQDFKMLDLTKFDIFKLNYDHYFKIEQSILKMYNVLNKKYPQKWFMATKELRNNLRLKYEHNVEMFYEEFKIKLGEMGFKLD